MSRLVAIIWLFMAWLIAALGGFAMHYSFEAGLGSLGVFAALMALTALVASIGPLSRSFDLWEQFGSAPSSPSPAPPAAVRAWEVPAPRTIVHEAGTSAGAVQTCARCGVVLIDPSSDRTIDGDPAQPVPAGTWIEQREDVFYPAGSPRELMAGEALCEPRADQPFSWQLAGDR